MKMQHIKNMQEVNIKNKIFDNETVRKLIKSEDDIEKGRTRKATEVIKVFKTKYGF